MKGHSINGSTRQSHFFIMTDCFKTIIRTQHSKKIYYKNIGLIGAAEGETDQIQNCREIEQNIAIKHTGRIAVAVYPLWLKLDRKYSFLKP